MLYRSSHASNLHIQIHSLSFHYHLFLWTSHHHYLLGITQFIFLFPSQYSPFNSSPYLPIFRNSFSYCQKLNQVYTLELSSEKQSTGERDTKTFTCHSLHSLQHTPRGQYCCLGMYTRSYCFLLCPTSLIGVQVDTQRDCPTFNRLLMQEKIPLTHFKIYFIEFSQADKCRIVPKPQ